MRGQRDPDLILIDDFNVSLSPRGMLSRQRINEYTKYLCYTTDQVNLTGMYLQNILSSKYTFFSQALRTFSQIGHLLGQKVNHNKHKKLKLFLVFYHIIMERS